ncbi:phosphate ABC transporter permease PstA [Vibrio fujianensis]|uniref:phosphate ABC transporter permease PstA n=1 Tax=Vibrio fujianensis TaxID=1974215 RepID=UPI000C16BE80|nr:phosphate ABC transporter permease PstA [Vibrio fujianensis]
MLQAFKTGTPWIWLTGGAVSISLISVLMLLLLIGWKGLNYFWPAPLYQWQTEQRQRLIGQLYASEAVSINHLHQLGIAAGDEERPVQRLNIKVANRERYDADFISILDSKLSAPIQPSGWLVMERTRDGQFFGKPVGFEPEDTQHPIEVVDWLAQAFAEAQQIRAQIDHLVHQSIRPLGHQLEGLRIKKQQALKQPKNGQEVATLSQQIQQVERDLFDAEQTLDQRRQQLDSQALLVEEMGGKIVRIPLSHILDYWYPNDMNHGQKLRQWGKQLWRFLSDNPRESNSEGGVFPAIFGTVLLVLLMSIIVMPLGVIAAVYLHEYAQDNPFTRLIRVAVINLAGVPSIVYGVFGLGFFVYTIGSSIDNLFYSDRLPAPTFGTPGLLWASLTLAVLTLPVVIVTTEEGLTRIPASVRHGSLALGATQFETIWRIVLPMASPAIITGLILAIARAAGEVAPLMLVGAVKLASNLPVDGEFPFVHLERKFMHLGFHIYDVGFQTTNIEAARPLVYATAFLLVTVVVSLNLTAIHIRNNLREKYRTLGQD